ncbi:MAG TPA: hypothetical protein DD473_09405 [Planctomycetaceae bacterium]|nr:hypothetical protein [Planctomycetaceae bacterium]
MIEPLLAGTNEFEIHWPPVEPTSEETKTKRPLLLGSVDIKEADADSEGLVLEIALTITRPSKEADREFWNSHLEFGEVPWMDEVRVWDADSQWQWPNLPFLLTRHGVERIERYGGVDPGKLVDNDFAAVLIRKYDKSGNREQIDSQTSPLVSAHWRSDRQEKTDIHSIVHVARSDTFRIHIGPNEEHTTGRLKLWLIYADFLNTRPPESWPRGGEWSGGILAYSEVTWDKKPNEPSHGTVQFLTPPTGSGFNWIEWSLDETSPAESRLADLPK